MIPISPTRERGRCGGTLIVTTLSAIISLAACGTAVYQQTPVFQQTPAQDRGGFFDSFSSLNPFASAPAPPAYSIPDVAGFGMYPLWKFHKFDGLSLRPVPYGVDIGKGLPVPPDPPVNPISFYSGPSPAGNGPPMKSSYPAPASPPATNYEASPPSQPPNPYGSYAQPSYGAPAPQQNPQILNYVPSGPPQYQAVEAPASYGAQPAQNPLTLSYQPASPQKYNEPAAPAYSAPAAAPSYAEPQGYGSPPANPGYGSQMSPQQQPYDGGMGGITIQFSAPPPAQEYGMQQQAPAYGSSPSGSYQMPAYSAIENPMTVNYQPVTDSKPMDAGYSGGYYKRNSYATEPEASKKMSTDAEGTISSEGSFSPK